MSVSACCPPGRGCNSAEGAEPCALELCRATAGENRDAAQAIARWDALVSARDRRGGAGEPRFRRRAYERSRDRVLIALALRGVPELRVPKTSRLKTMPRPRFPRRGTGRTAVPRA